MIKIGDTLYYCDTIRRPDGSLWRGRKITGETNLSWLLDGRGSDTYAVRVNKKTMKTARDRQGSGNRYYTRGDMENKIFCDRHARNVAAAVSACENADVLRQIAALVGETLEETA